LKFIEKLKDFINQHQQNWIFAKTHAKTWPHEYIVRDKVDEGLSILLDCLYKISLKDQLTPFLWLQFQDE